MTPSIILPRSSLLTISKSFTQPHLDYGNTIYDHPSKKSILNRVELIQYHAALAITGKTRGSSSQKLFQKFELENLHQRRCIRHLCFLYKVISTKQPTYFIHDLLSPMREFLQHPNTFNTFSCRNEYFNNSSLLSAISDWNKLNPNTLREKCPNTGKYGLEKTPCLDTSKSPYSVRIQENTDQKKIRIWSLFTQWYLCHKFQEGFVKYTIIAAIIVYFPKIAWNLSDLLKGKLTKLMTLLE